MAIGVAEAVKEHFGSKILLTILSTDSDEAKPYNFRSATNILVDDELIALEIATDQQKMIDCIAGKL